jgi:hypothetical protein
VSFFIASQPAVFTLLPGDTSFTIPDAGFGLFQAWGQAAGGAAGVSALGGGGGKGGGEWYFEAALDPVADVGAVLTLAVGAGADDTNGQDTTMDGTFASGAFSLLAGGGHKALGITGATAGGAASGGTINNSGIDGTDGDGSGGAGGDPGSISDDTAPFSPAEYGLGSTGVTVAPGPAGLGGIIVIQLV